MRWSCLITLIASLLVLCGCTQPEAPALAPTLPTSADQIKRVILVEAEGTVVHYQGESFWAEAEFSRILEAKDEFSSDIIAEFEADLSKYSQQAINANVEFNEDRESTILRCDIRGAISKGDSSYYAVFSWLLKPLGLDFIDNDFEESEKGLFWEGSANGIPTVVTVELPVIHGSVYEAWAHPIGHCHAHAWWKLP